jgi:hypothetical protein
MWRLATGPPILRLAAVRSSASAQFSDAFEFGNVIEIGRARRGGFQFE